MWHVRLFFPCGLRSPAVRVCVRTCMCDCTCLCVSNCDEFQLPASSLGRLPEHQGPSQPYFMLIQKTKKKKCHTFLPLSDSLSALVHYSTFVFVCEWLCLREMLEKTAKSPRSLCHNGPHCSSAIIRADTELGLETKRSLQPTTQLLEPRFTPNPGLES